MKHILATLCVLTWCSYAAHAQKKPVPKAKPVASTSAVSAATLAAGKTVYVQNCLTCHQADGGGVDNMNPPLTKTSYVLGEKPRLVKVILNGLQGEDIDGEPYNNVMPAFDVLSDQQIADVLTYVRNSFGNKASGIKAPEVKAIRVANKK
ncbi:cytochrome c [Hymenobacter tibetensis]|uniref:Cytochrome c n=1 Tax=Hymenobacter tibetensis TaxID=497967 RepID=A0ABY4CSE3_9BACT|nr:c-type cytochrome [Hymenobacter tibetensis]UOG73123.1 cytochrome c [Hymenobacter tibetensis]